MSSLSQKRECAAVKYEIGKYLMIETIEIKNYRCFKSVSLEGLKRVNIIVGDNASGKTALLEAIKLGLDGFPETLPFLNAGRQIAMVFPINMTMEQFQSQFIDFFHVFELQEDIVISIRDSMGKAAKVQVRFDPSKTTTIQPQLGFAISQATPSAPPPTTIIPLAFNTIDLGGKKDTRLATVNAKGEIVLEKGKAIGPASGLIGSTYFGGSGENAQWLSQLSITKRKAGVVKAIQEHFQFISDLTPESPFPGVAGQVYADLQNLDRKIPLSLVSAGISRIFTMILCMIQYSKGVVLIDEIENGIYFKQYPLLWKTLVNLAKDNETQVFITSHSLECLREALPLLMENKDDFLLLRISKENGSSKITPIASKFVEAAIEQGFDVR